jgi:hypothetical protein
MDEFYTDNESESNADIDVKNDIFNYKGYFVENEEDEEKKFYEFGAHFPYKYLYKRLEIIAKEREEEQKELEKKLKEKEAKESHNTNENLKSKDNIRGILNIFESKGKSRNRNDVVNGLTYMPKMNKNKNNFIYIDNVEINLLKSTSGKNQRKSNNKNKKVNTNNKNSSSNNFSSKYRDNKSTSKKKNSENQPKKSKNQIKIRKRNNPNIININNSLHSNINIFNKKKNV